jgi:hypothetical protein
MRKLVAKVLFETWPLIFTPPSLSTPPHSPDSEFQYSSYP